MDYTVISTGSKGNCVIIGGKVMVDCGVSWKAIKPYVKNLQIVLLSHAHSDHIRPSTIRKLQEERPTLRFGCGKWLLPSVIACGVSKRRIDVYIPNIKTRYSDDLQLIMTPLKHNVSNCGYKLYINGEKIFYATDCNNLDGIDAKGYDLYMIEANYEDNEIQDRIAEKEANGQYVYEYQVLQNHLSKKKADKFIGENAGINSKFVYLHGHEGSNFNE